MTAINQKEDAYIHYGNESTLEFIYGEVCLGRTDWEGGRQVGVSNSCRAETQEKLNESYLYYCTRILSF